MPHEGEVVGLSSPERAGTASPRTPGSGWRRDGEPPARGAAGAEFPGAVARGLRRVRLLPARAHRVAGPVPERLLRGTTGFGWGCRSTRRPSRPTTSATASLSPAGSCCSPCRRPRPRLGLAVLANKAIRGIGLFRTIFSSTVATSVAVASLIWFVLFQPSVGLLSQALPFDVLRNPGLLQDETWALPAVSLTRSGRTSVHVHRHLGGAPGHPRRPVRERGHRRSRRVAAVRQRDDPDAVAGAAVRDRRAHHQPRSRATARSTC